jgi:hypothetical protein
MAGFPNVAAFADALNEGRGTYATWRKSPAQVTTQGVWFDLSMSPGNPVPQYYAAAPLISVPLSQSEDGGLYHGGDIYPASKYLAKFTVMTPASATPLPMPMRLCDYLLYYPFIDEGTTDPQPLTNSVPLPRYADGAGVQMMGISVAGRVGLQKFQVTYTNSDGVAGRITPEVRQNNNSVNGSVVTTFTALTEAAGPFIPLQRGDTGVRSIDSVQMISGTDVGLFTLVLVKPLAQASVRGIDAPVEINYFTDFAQLPRIIDDAYLNLLCCPQGTLLSSPIHGDITTVWST